MLKHVLVPLDGSHLAYKALDFATHIVDSKCIISLLTVVQKPEIPLYSITSMATLNAEYSDINVIYNDAKRYLAGEGALLIQQGFVVTLHVERGDPAHTIVHIANEIDVDAIIMSTHGRSGLNRWIFGSVTGKVLSMAPRPVFVVPSYEMQKRFEHELSHVNVG